MKPALPKMRSTSDRQLHPNVDKMLIHERPLAIANNLPGIATALNTHVVKAIHQSSRRISKSINQLDIDSTNGGLTLDEDLNFDCVEHARKFVEALNALEDEFAKNFSTVYHKQTAPYTDNYWRKTERLQSLYQQCVEILKVHFNSASKYEVDLQALGKPITNGREWAERIAAIHNFRHRILSFLFSSECHLVDVDDAN